MARRGINQSAKPYDGHLSLSVQRVRMQRNLSVQLVELARETDMPLPTATGATAGGDKDRLRGVPCVGRGVSGAIRGSRPEDCLGRLEREARAAMVLVRHDGNGVSPGSDPVEELLRREAEVETARLLARRAELPVE